MSNSSVEQNDETVGAAGTREFHARANATGNGRSASVARRHPSLDTR